MKKKYYLMNTQFYPKTTPESEHEFLDVRIIPADQYPFKKVTDLFFALFLARMKTIGRQATDVFLIRDDLDLEEGRFIARIKAGLGGNEYVEAYLYEDEDTYDRDMVDVIIDGVPEFRSLDTLTGLGKWDIIYHGEQYPSDNDQL